MNADEALSTAHSLIKQGEPDQALKLCSDIINNHMDDETAQKALFMSAYVMMECERYGLAYNLYQRCAQLNPTQSQIWSNMGMCVEDFDLDRAAKCFEKAIKLDPNNANAWGNMGLIDLQRGDPKECIRKSQKSLDMDSSLIAPKHNMGLAHLMLRNWEEGWRLYAETLGVKHRERRDYGLPEWNGEPGTVIVYGEQGVGDEIMFASCLQDMAQKNSILLDCDRRLEGLFARSFDFPVCGTRFATETPLLDGHKPDYQCAIGQLPYFFRRNGDFPGNSYLKPDSERCLQWRALFDSFPGKKIGIAWTGGLPNTGKKRRSMTLSDLEPLFNPGNTYISLEYNPVELSELEKYGVKSYPRATGKGQDIDELAALVNELDMVVCPCTTVVYVAGALGIPCHVLVPETPGYRYHTEGEFPWFKSVKLHRQSGTWRDTVANNMHWL